MSSRWSIASPSYADLLEYCGLPSRPGTESALVANPGAGRYPYLSPTTSCLIERFSSVGFQTRPISSFPIISLNAELHIMSTLVTTPSEVTSSLSRSLADIGSRHRHATPWDAQTGSRTATRPSERGNTYSIPPASQAELLRRLESLRAGLSTLTREHQRADTEAFEDTMSVLNDEITDLLAVVVETSQ